MSTASRRADLRKLTAELYRVQQAYRGRRMPERVGRDFEAKAREAQALQQRVDAERGAWQNEGR